MRINESQVLNVELNRAVQPRATPLAVDGGSANRLLWAGSSGTAAGFFRATALPKPDVESETAATEKPPNVQAHESVSLLNLYCREIGQLKLLSREEEAALARRAREGDEAAREELIKANLRLVVKIALAYEGMGVALLDLISEGNIGLTVAVDRYDPARGAKLSVYAGYWIKNHIRRALCNHARTVRVPEYLHSLRPAVHLACIRLQELLGREPTHDEIAQEAGLPVRQVQRMRDAMQATVSLDKALDDLGGKSVADTVADEHAKAPDEALAHATTLQSLRQFLGELDPREQIILRARFGLDEEGDGTLSMVGQQLNLSRERIRQIEREALAKLRRKLTKLEDRLPAT